MARQPTALLSVSDKHGITELGRALVEHGWRILTTGGTAKALSEDGIPVTEVAMYTGFPEIMDGRVKTLHPKIHGGLLGRAGIDEPVMAQNGIDSIDLLAVNLYPFGATVSREDCSLQDGIEQIDVGGPAMLRAAAKNHAKVCVVCDPHDYPSVIQALPQKVGVETRRALAVKAFAHTAAYDAQISQWLQQQTQGDDLPQLLDLNLEHSQTLRYGENPHQAAGVYLSRGKAASGLAGAQPLQGKALSYNNLLDADAAQRALANLASDEPACVIIKHGNPCGVALGENALQAYERALACDPISAFGGIIAFNHKVDQPLARRLTEHFVELVVAPVVTQDALAVFSDKPNLRVMALAPFAAPDLELRSIDGGWLVQETDNASIDESGWKVATDRQPTAAERADMRFAWSVARSVKSNAIVYARNKATLGVGAGQMSRVDSARIGALKAQDAKLSLTGSTMASDAFFPFADSIETAAEHGISAVIQPGGSIRDSEVIAACNAHGMTMILTGTRHFKH